MGTTTLSSRWNALIGGAEGAIAAEGRVIRNTLNEAAKGKAKRGSAPRFSGYGNIRSVTKPKGNLDPTAARLAANIERAKTTPHPSENWLSYVPTDVKVGGALAGPAGAAAAALYNQTADFVQGFSAADAQLGAAQAESYRQDLLAAMPPQERARYKNASYEAVYHAWQQKAHAQQNEYSSYYAPSTRPRSVEDMVPPSARTLQIKAQEVALYVNTAGQLVAGSLPFGNVLLAGLKGGFPGAGAELKQEWQDDPPAVMAQAIPFVPSIVKGLGRLGRLGEAERVAQPVASLSETGAGASRTGIAPYVATRRQLQAALKGRAAEPSAEPVETPGAGGSGCWTGCSSHRTSGKRSVRKQL